MARGLLRHASSLTILILLGVELVLWFVYDCGQNSLTALGAPHTQHRWSVSIEAFALEDSFCCFQIVGI